MYITVLSRASAHWRSHLEHKKLGVGGYTEEVLERSNYPRASAHPARVYQIVASPVLCRGQPDCGESCIVLESGPTRSLVANFPKCSSLVVCKFRTAGEERCERGYGRVCAKPLCRMSWRLKHIRAIAAMYVSSVDLLFRLTTQQFSMVGGYTEDLKKQQHKTVKIKGGGRLLDGGRLLGTIRYCYSTALQMAVSMRKIVYFTV